MLFFALLLLLALLAIPVSKTWPGRMRIAMALALCFVGGDHWANPQRYLARSKACPRPAGTTGCACPSSRSLSGGRCSARNW